MSNERTNIESNFNQKTLQYRKRKFRTMRWFGESNIGPDHGVANTVAKFFISTTRESPEIFLVLMNREGVTREDGTIGFKAIYAGDIEKNAIPISMIDLDQLYNTLVTMKSRLERMKDDYHANGSRAAIEAGAAIEKAVLEVFNEKPLQPKRSNRPVQPLTHRMVIPKNLVAAVSSAAPVATPKSKQVPTQAEQQLPPVSPEPKQQQESAPVESKPQASAPELKDTKRSISSRFLLDLVKLLPGW
jgi:hypothetical protein